MGFLSKLHRSQKAEQKELEKKAEEFKKRIFEVSEEFGLQMIPIMTKYGLSFEIHPLKEKPKLEINEAGK